MRLNLFALLLKSTLNDKKGIESEDLVTRRPGPKRDKTTIYSF